MQRSFVLLLGIICAIYLKDKLDTIVALSGSIMGTTVVMIVPVLSHYKLVLTQLYSHKLVLTQTGTHPYLTTNWYSSLSDYKLVLTPV